MRGRARRSTSPRVSDCSDIPRDRKRYNGALVLDYKLDDGKSEALELRQLGKYRHCNPATNSSTLPTTTICSSFPMRPRHSISSPTALHSSTLSFGFQTEVNLSHTYSEVSEEEEWTANFLQTSAGLGGFTNMADVNPEDVPKAANNNIAQAILNGISTSASLSRERAWTAAVDLKKNLDISTSLNADIKFGGKYRYVTRSYDYDLYNGGGLQFGDAQYINDLIISHFQLPVERYRITLPVFFRPEF